MEYTRTDDAKKPRDLMELHGAIAEIHQQVVELRHDIHRHPEPGFEETRTQATIRSALGKLGLEPRDCAKTGLVVDIGTGSGGGGGGGGGAAAGKTIALRADLDCLRMTEENTALPYRSAREGLAHMCGHDGHIATLVGAAQLLTRVRDQLPGTVRLLFQPAEEGPGGAPLMIEEGALEAVDEVYGMHNWPGAPLGSLLTVSGPCMAHVCTMTITVRGKGGHAAQPHEAIDPIVAAAQVVTALQTIVSRDVHCTHSAVVSVTMIHGGEVHNVIPDSVELTGSIRVLDDADYDLVEGRIRTIATQTAAAYGAQADFDFERLYPVLVNHPAEASHVERVGRAVLGDGAVSSDQLPMLASEDFAYYTRHTPGCFFFLGSAEEGRTNSMCHATNYDFNDGLLAPGISMWLRLVEDRLGVALYA